MRCVLLLVTLAVGVLPTANSFASLIGFQFSGVVNVATQAPYGNSVPAFSPVVGQFYFDTDTPAILSGGGADISTYAQQIPGGFSATFGTLPVAASSYVVQVSNNILQPSGNFADIVRIQFSNLLNPPPQSPLMVNGVEQTVGLFSLNLMGSGNLYSNSALPLQLALSNFPTNLSFFADTPTGTVDVLFSVTSLGPVPEPPTAILFGFAVVLAVARQWLILLKSRRFASQG